MTHQRSSGSDVTVLVVAYRHADYVVECLESIRQQSIVPGQIIIADDNSPDDTSAIISAYLDTHPGFGELRRNDENIGLNRTLNKNLATVTTKYVTYLSADDIMLPQRVERHLSLMDHASDAVLAYSDAIVIDANSIVLHETSQTEFPWPQSSESRERPFSELLHTNWMPAASLFLRTAELQRAGSYRDDLFYEDFELLVRLSKHHQFVWTEEPLVGVRRPETSLGSTGFSSTNPAFLIALDAALRHYEDAENALRAPALSKRWELAKRASRSPLARRHALKLLWDARAGSGSPLGTARHFSEWAFRTVGFSLKRLRPTKVR